VREPIAKRFSPGLDTDAVNGAPRLWLEQEEP
jgi:hypothetical protein